MLERLVRLCEDAHRMNTEERLLTILSLAGELSDAVSQNEAMSAQSTEMALQYGRMKDELDGAKREIERLGKLVEKLSGQLGQAKNDLWGRSTEKLSEVFEGAMGGEEACDPVDENAPDPDAAETGTKETMESDPGSENDPAAGPAEAGAAAGGGSGEETGPEDILGKPGGRSRHGIKKPGKRKEDLSGIPVRTEYDIDVDELDRLYGEGNWRIRGWSSTKCYEKVKCPVFIRERCAPVLSVGLEHHMVRVPNGNPLLRGSLVSPSLAADIMYSKFALAHPLYRQSMDLAADGISITRQTMSNWMISLGFGSLGPVYDLLCDYVRSTSHNQCDETHIQVIDDGRRAGSVSYMWLHAVSELLDVPPAVVFCFEKTRGTDHLRNFYGNRFNGVITSDGYCSYPVYAKETDGAVTISGCLMHCRRYFSNALLIMDISGMSLEQVMLLPEIKALILIREIYLADEPLKHLSPEERLDGRDKAVRPKVTAFFEYVESLDMADPSYSEKLREAIQYTRNQKQKLLLFLEDPSIPLDNGYAERCIRALCLTRRNSLFCYSIDGAIAFAIIITLVETARLNGAHPYYYLKYLLEVMPGYIGRNTIPKDGRLFPWSEQYRQYEEKEKRTALEFFIDPVPPAAPKTPRKKDPRRKSA